MTLGEKIKKARTENGLTQVELAEKLMVSRQAITKWESDKGMPDVGNLKALAQLLNVSVDYLLDNGDSESLNVIHESIDLSKYGKAVIKKKLTDKLMKEKFSGASVHTLIVKKKMDKADKAVETVLFLTTPFVNAVEFLNSLKVAAAATEYYLVNDEERQYFVAVNAKDGVMETRRMIETVSTQTGTKFEMGEFIFMVCGELK